MVYLLALFLLALSPLTAFAESSGSSEPSRSGETVSYSQSDSTRPSYELLTQVSVVAPTAFTLRDQAFEVPYSDSYVGFSALQLTLARKIWTWNDIRFFAQASAGYGTKEAKVPVFSASGPTYQMDDIRLHWLPFSASLRTVWPVPGASFIKPGVTLGAGTQLIHQAGSLPGLKPDFWIPYYFITPSLALMEADSPDDWFGGVTFGTTFFNSAAGRSRMLRGMSFDLSMTILL